MRCWLSIMLFVISPWQALAAPPAPVLCPAQWRPGEPIVVALLDTGLDTSHPYFRESIWVNGGESGIDSQGRDKATNGIDDDGNGYVDDIHGWNFAHETADVSDPHGHGTHIAGLLVSRSMGKSELSKADIETTPATPVRLMVLKYSTGETLASKAGSGFRAALRYALDRGAHFIQIAGGGYGPVPGEGQLLREAADRRIPVVGASGNKRPHQQDRLFFPSGYAMDNILSVVATDLSGRILATSNQNPGRPNFLEVGENVFSTLPGGRAGELSGTSQAAGSLGGKYLHRMMAECPAVVARQTEEFLFSSAALQIPLNSL